MQSNRKYAGALVDMDGTLYRGETPIPGASEAIGTLRDAGIAVQFLTNNPTRSPAEYVERLAGMGIEATEESIVTAGVVTADYLAREHGDDRLFVVGEPSFVSLLTDAGLSVTEAPQRADVVVLSLDTGIDFRGWTDALRAVGPETPIVATNPDRTKPGTDGVVPSAGLVIGGVEGMTGRSPDTVAGKPSEVAARFALDRLGVSPERCLLIGDRLDTDIEMGERVGITTLLVRTGVTGDAELDASNVEPDHVLDSIADVDTVVQ